MIDTSHGVVKLFTKSLLLLSAGLVALVCLGLIRSGTVVLLCSGSAFFAYKTLARLLALHYVRLLDLVDRYGLLERFVVPTVSLGQPTPIAEDQQRDERETSPVDAGVGLVMQEVDKYVQFIMRDFVASWYHGSVSANAQFTDEIRYALEDVSVALVSRARKLSPHLLLGRAVRLYHRHFLSFLSEVRSPSSMSSDQWHVALSSSSNELRYLQNVVNVLLEVLVPADVLVCPVGRRLVVTLLAHRLLLPTVDLLSDPDWINRKVVAMLGGGDATGSTGSSSVAATTVSRSGGCDELDVSEDSGRTDVGEVPNECRWAGGVGSRGVSLERTTPPPGAAASDEPGVTPELEPEGGDGKDSTDSGIWQRMVDELPSAFRTERQQEVSEILQEAATAAGGVVAGTQVERRLNLRMPLSGSLDKISDLFTSAINVEFITGNLAHYFKLSQLGASDEERTIQQPPPAAAPETSRRSPSVSDDVDNETAGRVRDDHPTDNDPSPGSDHHNVSSVLERVIPMSMGPLMSGLAGRGGRTTESKSEVEAKERPAVEQEEMSVATTFALRSEEMTLAWKQLGGSSDPVFEVTDTTTTLCATDFCAKDPITDGVGDPSDQTVCRATFARLTIPSTEVIDEPGSGGQYVAYCIQYDAWFREPDTIKTFDIDSYVDVSEPRASLQTNYVRRRFREFLALQVRLEEDPQLRPHIKGIRGPSKWSVLPFNKLDKDALNERRISLERYLLLLISKEPILSSDHLREFLAYGCDASIAYVRKISDLNLPVPRFDKFLMRTMTGVFDKLKTALPSLPHDPSPVDPVGSQNKTDRFLGFLNFNNSSEIATGTDASQLRLSFDYGLDSECVDNVEDLLNQYLGSYDAGNDKVDTAYDAADIDAWLVDPWSLPSPSSLPSGVVSELEDSTEIQSMSSPRHEPTCSKDDDQKSLDDLFPLASAVINFSAETIQDDNVKVDGENFVFVMKILFGKVLDKWICDMIDTSLTEQASANCLRRILETFWPEGDSTEQSCNLRTESDKKQAYEVALQCLKQYFPSLFVFILGPQYDTGMKLFLDSLQHPKLLRNVVYHLLDLLVDSLIIRSRSQSIIDKLGSVS